MLLSSFYSTYVFKIFVYYEWWTRLSFANNTRPIQLHCIDICVTRNTRLNCKHVAAGFFVFLLITEPFCAFVPTVTLLWLKSHCWPNSYAGAVDSACRINYQYSNKIQCINAIDSSVTEYNTVQAITCNIPQIWTTLWNPWTCVTLQHARLSKRRTQCEQKYNIIDTIVMPPNQSSLMFPPAVRFLM